jgi:hypothetical protein
MTSPTLAARRLRVRRIRRTVTTVAVAVFLALFATIYIQMAAGRDPALSSSSATASTATASSTSTDSSSSDGTSSSQDTTTAPMTTQQS